MGHMQVIMASMRNVLALCALLACASTATAIR